MLMSRLARVLEVEHLGEFRLRLTFSDGLVRELDVAGVIEGRGGVFEPFGEPAFFAQVAVDTVAGTIVWPNGVDLDPDVLHGDHEPASGRRATVLKQYRLRPTALPVNSRPPIPLVGAPAVGAPAPVTIL